MNTDGLLQAARSNLNAGKLDQAEFQCLRVLEASPDQCDALHILARVHTLNGKPDEGLELLQRIIRNWPQFGPAYGDLGAILLLENRVSESIEPLEEALRLDPGFVDARMNLANALHRLGDYAEAESLYRVGLEAEPGHARGWTNLGNLLRLMHRPEEAIECFEHALRHAPHEVIVHNAMGVAYQDLGKIDLAVAAFERALQLSPDDSEANSNIGLALMQQERYQEAIAHFDKAGRRDSTANALICLLHTQGYDAFFSRVRNVASLDPGNLHVASISAYASQQLQRDDPFPFCSDPMDYVRIVEKPGGSELSEQFLADLIREAGEREALWEPKGISTKKGFQTASTLFQAATGTVSDLATILRTEVEAYREAFADRAVGLINDWPAETVLNGWFVRLVSEGHQRTHNHPEGWLSGCLYLRVPTDVPSPEGAIEFTLKKAVYPEVSAAGPTKLHMPKAGQLALFPSSLFHHTIPFHTDDERLCIAFDVAPL